ncbi:MAG: carnitine dehydratase [Rhodospirillaceae bacterium]|nr:carnitine dehydratase [Rhodospirillaceae bacterium]
MVNTTSPAPKEALKSLWQMAGSDAEALTNITITGKDPVLSSIFRLGTVAAATIGASSLAAAELWYARTGRRQRVSINLQDAAVAFCSEKYTRIIDKPRETFWAPASGYYRTRDNRWIQLHCQFPHLRDGVLKVLGCSNNPTEVRQAVADWDGLELETRCREDLLCVALIRSPEEWSSHPQAQALSKLPLIEVSKIGDAPPTPLPAFGDSPLTGVKVLDLTKVIAGPVCGRTLASHGAQVIRIGAAHLPLLEPLVIDTGLGKRSAFLDLRLASDSQRLREMAYDADIFVQGYRPGTIAGRGFGPEEVAELKPGIVYVTLSAYGHKGPWSRWRGFDSLTQSASGIVYEGMIASGTGKPHPLPCQALDHGTGYLAAFGAMVALRRRAVEGGSWMVRVSLAQTGRWINELGRIDGLSTKNPEEKDISDLLEIHGSPWGDVLHVKSPELMSETSPHWHTGPVPVGTHSAAWV